MNGPGWPGSPVTLDGRVERGHLTREAGRQVALEIFSISAVVEMAGVRGR